MDALRDSDISPEQCRAARGWLDWSQGRLASAAGVSLSTVCDFEKDRRIPKPKYIAAIQRVLEQAGIAFTLNAVGYPGKPKQPRQGRPRVSARLTFVPREPREPVAGYPFNSHASPATQGSSETSCS
jgi:DNA-binding XRE family transcriptional regulator